DRVLHSKCFKPFAECPAVLGPLDHSLIKNHADTHVTAFQRNPPAPPAVADHMVSGGITSRINGTRPEGIFLGQFAAIPVFDAFPSRPRRCGWMFGVRFPPAVLSSKNCSNTRCVNNPTRTNCSRAVAIAKCYRLFFSRLQLHIDYRCGTQNLRASNTGSAQHFFIKRGTIQLIRWHPYLIKRPELARFRQRLYFAVCKPKPQSF